jgi:hypothetical protein
MGYGMISHLLGIIFRFHINYHITNERELIVDQAAGLMGAPIRSEDARFSKYGQVGPEGNPGAEEVTIELLEPQNIPYHFDPTGGRIVPEAGEACHL